MEWFINYYGDREIEENLYISQDLQERMMSYTEL